MPAEKSTFTTRKYECPKCGQRTKRLDWDYDAPPKCTSCEGSPDMVPELWSHGASAGVIGDECDITLQHVLPGRRFTSRSELKKEMEARGYESHVTHQTQRGTDKSPHTTRWV